MKKIGLGNKFWIGPFLGNNPKREGTVAQIAGPVDSEDLEAHLTLFTSGRYLHEFTLSYII